MKAWCLAFASCFALLLTESGGANTRTLLVPGTRCAFATSSGLQAVTRRPFVPRSNRIRHENPTIHHYRPTDDSSDEDSDLDYDPLPQAPRGAPSDSEIESATLNWIHKSVVGLNLCPFAKRPIETNQLSTHVVRGDDHNSIAAAVSAALLAKQEESGTALVIAPEYYPEDFERYMSMVQFLEQRVMEFHELHDDVQIAPFHPLFTFDGSGDEIHVYTNRSPYPMFHVLRVDEVSRAVEKLDGDPGKVWRRNVVLLQNLEEKLGRLGVVKFLMGRGKEGNGNDVDATEIVEEVLKKTKEEMEEEEKEGGGKQIVRGGWVR